MDSSHFAIRLDYPHKNLHFLRYTIYNSASNFAGVVNTKWGPLRIGLYCRHLHRWLQYFPLSQFLFISGERLISDPAYELQRVEEFLNLRPVIKESDFYLNTTKGFPCILRKARPHCLGKTKGRNHPAIDPAALKRLRQFYRPFNRKFYEMTGMDFGWL